MGDCQKKVLVFFFFFFLEKGGWGVRVGIVRIAVIILVTLSNTFYQKLVLLNFNGSVSAVQQFNAIKGKKIKEVWLETVLKITLPTESLYNYWYTGTLYS